MKLLLCPDCGDVFNLSSAEKSCTCGTTRGYYVDNLNAVYEGGIPLGFTNSTFLNAVRTQPQSGLGREFTAFVIPKECPTFKEQTLTQLTPLVDVVAKMTGADKSVARRMVVMGDITVNGKIVDNPGFRLPNEMGVVSAVGYKDNMVCHYP